MFRKTLALAMLVCGTVVAGQYAGTWIWSFSRSETSQTIDSADVYFGRTIVVDMQDSMSMFVTHDGVSEQIYHGLIQGFNGDSGIGGYDGRFGPMTFAPDYRFTISRTSDTSVVFSTINEGTRWDHFYSLKKELSTTPRIGPPLRRPTGAQNRMPSGDHGCLINGRAFSLLGPKHANHVPVISLSSLHTW